MSTQKLKNEFVSISIPKCLYFKLFNYAKHWSLSIRQCSKIIIEESIKQDTYAKVVLKNMKKD